MNDVSLKWYRDEYKRLAREEAARTIEKENQFRVEAQASFDGRLRLAEERREKERLEREERLRRCPVHPGQLLKEEKFYGCTISEFAVRLGLARKTVHALIKGEGRITVELAARISLAFCEKWPREFEQAVK